MKIYIGDHTWATPGLTSCTWSRRMTTDGTRRKLASICLTTSSGSKVSWIFFSLCFFALQLIEILNLRICMNTHENPYENRLFYFPDPSGELDQVMRDSKVDAVIISTPTFTHEELVDKSLEAGKAVFCEKPLAETVEATRRLYAKAEKVRIVFGSISQPTYRSEQVLSM